jgi:hypothetical protein
MKPLLIHQDGRRLDQSVVFVGLEFRHRAFSTSAEK